jgi:hypothetical protein
MEDVNKTMSYLTDARPNIINRRPQTVLCGSSTPENTLQKLRVGNVSSCTLLDISLSSNFLFTCIHL